MIKLRLRRGRPLQRSPHNAAMEALDISVATGQLDTATLVAIGPSGEILEGLLDVKDLCCLIIEATNALTAMGVDAKSRAAGLRVAADYVAQQKREADQRMVRSAAFAQNFGMGIRNLQKLTAQADAIERMSRVVRDMGAMTPDPNFGSFLGMLNEEPKGAAGPATDGLKENTIDPTKG